MLKRKYILIFIGLFVMAFGGLYLLPVSLPVVVETSSDLTVCVPASLTSALPLIAQKKNFFSARGLRIKMNVELGIENCLKQMLAKNADLAVSPLAPVVKALKAGSDFKVITEVQRSHQNPVIVHLQADQKKPFDLTGKKVALLQGSYSENFLRLFLMTQASSLSRLDLISIPSPAEALKLLEQKKVDAAVIWEPFLSKFIGASDGIFDVEPSSFYTDFSVLVASRNLAAENSSTIYSVVKALHEAQRLYDIQTAEAQKIILDALNLSPDEVDHKAWEKMRFEVGLSAVLLSMMRQSQQSRDPQERFLTETSGINIFKSLFPQALRSLSKDLVTYE